MPPAVPVGYQDSGYKAADIFGAHTAEDLARDALLVIHAAAEHHVVAFAAVGELGRNQPDVSAVVLRARMWASGEVDVHGRTEIGHAIAHHLHER